MSIFSKKEKNVETRQVYFTNAPNHWPKIPVPDTVIKGDEQGIVDFFRILKSTFQSSNSGIENRNVNMTKLDSEGILEVPFLLFDNNKVAIVVHCPIFDEDTATKFNGLSNYMLQQNANAYYFSLKQIPTNKIVNPHREISWDDFEKFEEEVPKEDYAMWWNIEGQPNFPNSETIISMDQVYSNLDGYISYFYGLMLANLGLIETRTRVRIPENSDIPFIGPEHKLIIMNVSQEKGVKFLFPVNSCKGAYRDNFWKAMARFTKSFNEFAVEQKWEKDAPHETYSSPLQWWKFAMKSAKNQEQEIKQFGLLFFGK